MITDHDITEAMTRFGGSFIQGLAELYAKADPLNQRRLRVAFSDDWARYRDLAERWEAEHPTVTR